MRRIAADSSTCRRMPSFAVPRPPRALQSAPGSRQRGPIGERDGQPPGTPPSVRPPEDRLDSWKEIAAYLNRDVTTVQRWEKREGMPVHRHLHDRMGSVYASAPSWTRGCAAGIFEQSRRTRERRPAPEPLRRPRQSRPDGGSSWPLARLGAALAIGAGLWLAEDRVLLAKPHRRRAISESHGLRWRGAGRRGVTRRSFRGVSLGPGRTDGRLGHAGRLGTVPQPDPRERAGARQSIGPHAGVLARWLAGHLLGSQAGRLERRRHQHLGGADARRPAEAVP